MGADAGGQSPQEGPDDPGASGRSAHLRRAEELRRLAPEMTARLEQASDAPADDAVRAEVLAWAIKFAVALDEGGEPEEATPHYRFAFGLGQTLLARAADDLAALRFTARSALGLMEVLIAQRKGRESMDWALALIPLARRVTELDPASADGPVTESQACRHMGLGSRAIAMRSGSIDDWQAELTWLQRAAGNADEAYRREPDRRQASLEWAVSCMELGITSQRGPGSFLPVKVCSTRVMQLLEPLEAAGTLPANITPVLAWARSV